jgi:hypothetical protein
MAEARTVAASKTDIFFMISFPRFVLLFEIPGNPE